LVEAGSGRADTVRDVSEKDFLAESSHGTAGAKRPADSGAPAPSARGQSTAWRLRDQRIGVGTIVAATLVIGFVVWFRLDLQGSAQQTPGRAVATQARGPIAASPAELRSLAASLGHPVYWAGPRPGTTYELTVSASGQTFVRYLPKGVPAGSKSAYLTVATYPVANAYAATSELTGSDVVTIQLPNNGIAEYTKGHETNVHLAFPGVDLQVEVFDPAPSVPPEIVASGAVVPV
jgi:hypothetical protein